MKPYEHGAPAGKRGGSSYHVSFRSGSRAGGACASAAHDYITRSGEYDDPDRDPAIYVESDHIPEWAEDDPREYWDAADLYERDNGRLYVSADVALPRGLSDDEQVALARSFVADLTSDEKLPCTFAIHRGYDGEGKEHNPHVHVMFSERKHDGVARSKEQWFRRANRKEPERGGASKSRTFHGRQWVERAREKWAEHTNRALESAGREERVDHRSYERQGIDREPGEHYGPAAAYMVARGKDHDRLTEEASRGDLHEALAHVEWQIAQVQGQIDEEATRARQGGRDGGESGERSSDRGRGDSYPSR
jgi:hypothetical protein